MYIACSSSNPSDVLFSSTAGSPSISFQEVRCSDDDSKEYSETSPNSSQTADVPNAEETSFSFVALPVLHIFLLWSHFYQKIVLSTVFLNLSDH